MYLANTVYPGVPASHRSMEEFVPESEREAVQESNWLDPDERQFYHDMNRRQLIVDSLDIEVQARPNCSLR